jgi:molecular chaperone GrpE
MHDEEDVQIETDGFEEHGGDEDELEATEALASAKIAKLRKELEQARKEKQENLDGWQRAKADYVNALKRFEEEKRTAIEYGTLKAALAFIPAIDSLERAKTTVELPEGFAGILKQLEDATRKIGLERFGTTGEKFDPQLHEAFAQERVGSREEDDTILEILEPGWRLGEQVIRPAKVKVGILKANVIEDGLT